MATIAVRVGREIKEISGLTKSTTCWDVVLALLKEKQHATGTDSANGAAEKAQPGERGTEESASNSSTSKPIKELAQSYVIVENWRGCEKPIPPRTRILNVWQAWGKEQRHVELSLKKSKHIRYREGGHQGSRSQDNKSGGNGAVAPDHYSLHCMSHHQKRRIRRNMRQYQRAVMMKQNEDDVVDSDDLQNQNDNSDNTRVLFEDTKQIKTEQKSEKRNGLVLSEEKFVDGFLADPDCLIRRADRAHLISQGTFNREFCKYRRRNRKRHSSIDGVDGSRQHRRRQVSHYPYSSQHDRRRSSRRRGQNAKSPKYRYSTDDTSTTTTTTTNSSEDEKAEDADDEKSVLIEFACSIPRRSHPYGVGLGGCAYGGSGTTTTATDSSTTTSGDSMTSSMGCSTSSETSSGGDYYFPEINRLSYGKAIENAKKSTENSSTKPKKNKSILGGFSKPALNLIESFRKTNLKRKSGKKNNPPPSKQESPTEVTSPTLQNGDVKKPEVAKSGSDGVKKTIPDVPREVKNEEKDAEDVTVENDNKAEDKEAKETPQDDGENQNDRDDVLQTVQSQDIVLKNQQNRLGDTDAQIQQIENDIHDLRTRALGKNYVQDTYLSEVMDSDSNSVMGNIFTGPSTPVTTPWILQCEDVEMLEQFTKMSEKIVEMQLKIEEYNRKSEILLQDMQEEVWRVSTDTAERSNKGISPVTKAAALMLGFSEEEDVTDDEEGHELLSVKSWNENGEKPISSTTETTAGLAAQDSLHLELETSRTELEASLYLSLRLAAEIGEVEHKLGTSDYLIQRKGENLIKCVRDLAMSEEGVDPEIWEEYGELLNAYDMEVEQRKYLEVLEASHMAVLEAETTTRWSEEENTLYIDATSPNPTSHCVNGHDRRAMLQPTPNALKDAPLEDAPVVEPPALNQALSPWMWCEHCKMDEQMKQTHAVAQCQSERPRSQQTTCGVAACVKVQPPTLFSKLPLPKPVNKASQPMNFSGRPHTPSVITSGLLPMLPIPDGLMSPPRHNDSDYEDLPDLTSMGPPDPSKSSREQNSNESSNNTDDSGNASAGSTASFASSDGSRNSSCDGGSPRPLPTASDATSGSKPLFGRNGVLRGSWKGHFVFPLNSKQSSSQSQPSSQYKFTQSSKPVPPPPPPACMKPRLKKPETLPKPNGLPLKKPTTIDPKEKEILLQQEKLIKRNSGSRRKNFITTKCPSVMPSEANAEKNISTFKNSAPNQNNGSKIEALCKPVPPKIISVDQAARSNSNYDNDSDTGRSSLHSVDSDQVLFSETLV